MRLWKIRALPRHSLQITRRWFLRRRYGFDYWHVAATPAARPYKRAAAETVISLGVGSVVDVGCGLGDLAALLPDAVRYVGLDIQRPVLDAAAKMHPGRTFGLGSFGEAAEIGAEMLVAVNWINTLRPEYLEQELSVAGRSSEYILIDSVRAGSGSYDHQNLRIPGFEVMRTISGAWMDRNLIVHQRTSA